MELTESLIPNNEDIGNNKSYNENINEIRNFEIDDFDIIKIKENNNSIKEKDFTDNHNHYDKRDKIKVNIDKEEKVENPQNESLLNTKINEKNSSPPQSSSLFSLYNFSRRFIYFLIFTTPFVISYFYKSKIDKYFRRNFNNTK
jgi:hypothetical protein